MADINQMRNQFFKSKREQAANQFTPQKQEADDALQRRFTAMGQAGSGAAVSAHLKQNQNFAEAQRNAMRDIDDQEIAANLQAHEGQAGREFQGQQAELARKFQAGESGLDRGFQGTQMELGRKFQSGESALARQLEERQAGLQRSFAGEQAGLDRALTSSESLAQRKFAADQAQRGRDFQDKWSKMDLDFNRQNAFNEQRIKLRAMDLAEAQFVLDKETTDFNKQLAAAEAGKDGGGLLGNIGIGGGGGGTLGTAVSIGLAAVDPLNIRSGIKVGGRKIL